MNRKALHFRHIKRLEDQPQPRLDVCLIKDWNSETTNGEPERQTQWNRTDTHVHSRFKALLFSLPHTKVHTSPTKSLYLPLSERSRSVNYQIKAGLPTLTCTLSFFIPPPFISVLCLVYFHFIAFLKHSSERDREEKRDRERGGSVIKRSREEEREWV